MRRVVLAISIAALGAAILPQRGDSSGRFDQPLSPDQQILQALNRLTFGARPGEAEQVRRMGVAQWIEQQLHPDQIEENPAVAEHLKPLDTLGVSLAELGKEYGPQPPQLLQTVTMNLPMSLNTLLGPDDMRKVQMGTAEERTAVLKALDPDKRRQVLAMLPPNVLEFTPEFKAEAEELSKARQEEMQRQNRMRNPQLQDLLNPDQISIARSGNREQLLALFAYLDPSKRARVAALLPQQSLAEVPEFRREAQKQRQPRLVISEDLKEAKLFRAIDSNRQLEEVLVDFWMNHFNVDLNKNLQLPRGQNEEHLLLSSFERDAIRPHIFGHFKDLLLATARHPAMLYYLDNWESMAPQSFDVGPFAPNRGVVNGVPNSVLPGPLSRLAHGLNENYGREVMELHTLGVKGGYTQDDVIAVARCFTGWTVTDPEDPQFIFAPFMHDFGEKTVLGHKLPAGRGEQDGLEVIDILAHHPSTAKFISRELAQRFVADDPPQALVDRMAQTFDKTDGDLRAVLETLFTSPEFFSQGAWLAKIKSPLELVVSAVRAVGGDISDTYTLAQKVADLGEPLYSKLEPTGYPNTGDAWLSTAGIMGRMNLGASLASGFAPGVRLDNAAWNGKDPAAVARDILGRDPSEQTLAALQKGLEGQPATAPFIASLVIGSPDFQRR